MKKLIFAILLLMAVSVSAQEFTMFFADSVSNSKVKTGYLGLTNYTKDGAVIDSIAIGIYAYGEIDIDTCEVFGGVMGEVTYPQTGGVQISVAGTYETTSLGEALLTINQDSAGVDIVPEAVVLTSEAIQGYNTLKMTITAAASGNTATDPKQKVVLYAQIYTHK